MLAALSSASFAADAPPLDLVLSPKIEIVFDQRAGGCSGFAMPDIYPRAVRTADGGTLLFALEQMNRPLKGASLSFVKPDCNSVLESRENPDPSAFDGRRYLTALWTEDGRNIAGLVHDEYHAEQYEGRCKSAETLACWYNTIIEVTSRDAGKSFAPASPLVVAAAPFRQETEQGRHRGFFNPSNMFRLGGYVYAFASTTGWDGQSGGACLIRNADPMDSAGWRGWDGRAFTVRWSDPYRVPHPVVTPCAPIKPFGYNVASVVRHRPTNTFIALWEQPKLDRPTPFGTFPAAGFWMATSKNLIDWSAPALAVPTHTINQPCGAREENRDRSLFGYPAILDEAAEGRNYDDIGDKAWLYFTQIGMDGCNPGPRRALMRRALTVAPRAAPGFRVP